MAETPDKWKLVNEVDDGTGYVRTTRILPIPDTGCLVHTTTVRNRVEGGPLLSEALTFVPNIDSRHFGV